MKHQTNIRWLFPLRKDILYWIEAINLSPVSLFVKPFCLFRLFTTVYTQPRLSRWYIAFCNADSNHFLDFCITAKVVKIISNISAQLVPNTRPLVEFFHCPILFDSVMKKLGNRSGIGFGAEETLPKAQRTRGLSSSCQSNFLRSYHKFKHKSWSHFIFRISTGQQLQNLNKKSAYRRNLNFKSWPNLASKSWPRIIFITSNKDQQQNTDT